MGFSPSPSPHADAGQGDGAHRDGAAVRPRRQVRRQPSRTDEPDSAALAKLKRADRLSATGGRLPPRPEDPRARRRFLRPGRAGAVSAMHAALPQPTAGPSGSGWRSMTRLGAAFLPLRAAARQPPAAARAALSRPPVPRVQSRHRRRPRLPLRAAARRSRTACSTSAPRARARRPTAATPTAG